MTLLRRTHTLKPPKMKKKASQTKLRPPDYRWVDEEATFENSVQHKELFVDSCFLYALIWTFGSVLTQEVKYEFDTWLKSCFETRVGTDLDTPATHL